MKANKTNQIKIVEYFRGFVHLSHGDHDLIINVLFVKSHVKADPGLQCGFHLQQDRTNMFNGFFFDF